MTVDGAVQSTQTSLLRKKESSMHPFEIMPIFIVLKSFVILNPVVMIYDPAITFSCEIITH